jgi:hypothetical protein
VAHALKNYELLSRSVGGEETMEAIDAAVTAIYAQLKQGGNKPDADFHDTILTLLLSLKDKGIITIDHRGSAFFDRLRRWVSSQSHDFSITAACEGVGVCDDAGRERVSTYLSNMFRQDKVSRVSIGVYRKRELAFRE